MNLIPIVIALAVAVSSPLFAQSATHVGTWELVNLEMNKRAGAQYPVHRLILTTDGKYLNSATRGGPIPTNYKLEADKNVGGLHSFLIEAPDDHKFGRAAGLRLDEGRLVMIYFDGRVLTYSKISEDADKTLLVSPEGKNITIKKNKTEAEQDASGNRR